MTNDSITLTPRQRLVDTLCGDLNAQGWDQPNKLWYLKGDASDEWLEYAGEFNGAPENHLVDLIAANKMPADATGVLIASEGWAYPKALTASFKTDEALRAYWRLNPPSEHANKVEIRHLLLATRDGEVLGLTYRHEGEGVREWARLDASVACPTGDRVVDAARGMLGINPDLVNRVKSNPMFAAPDSPAGKLAALGETTNDLLGQIKNISDTLQAVNQGEISEEEATVRLFRSVPEHVRRQIVEQMPPELREVFRRLLPPDEGQRYGL